MVKSNISLEKTHNTLECYCVSNTKWDIRYVLEQQVTSSVASHVTPSQYAPVLEGSNTWSAVAHTVDSVPALHSSLTTPCTCNDEGNQMYELVITLTPWGNTTFFTLAVAVRLNCIRSALLR